jgi:hypothetical protein
LEERHVELGPEPWKIFANAVEGVIRERGNLEKEEKKREELREYEAFVNGK